MNTCKECKHFRVEDNMTFGTCKLQETYEEKCSVGRFRAKFLNIFPNWSPFKWEKNKDCLFYFPDPAYDCENNVSYVALYFGPDFGCIHWEGK